MTKRRGFHSGEGRDRGVPTQTTVLGEDSRFKIDIPFGKAANVIAEKAGINNEVMVEKSRVFGGMQSNPRRISEDIMFVTYCGCVTFVNL